MANLCNRGNNKRHVCSSHYVLCLVGHLSKKELTLLHPPTLPYTLCFILNTTSVGTFLKEGLFRTFSLCLECAQAQLIFKESPFSSSLSPNGFGGGIFCVGRLNSTIPLHSTNQSSTTIQACFSTILFNPQKSLEYIVYLLLKAIIIQCVS